MVRDIERLCLVFLLFFEDSGLGEQHALDVLVVRPRVVAAPLKHEHLVGLLLVVCQKRHMRWRKRPHARAREHTVSLPSSQGASERRSREGTTQQEPPQKAKKRGGCVGGGSERRVGGGKKSERKRSEQHTCQTRV